MPPTTRKRKQPILESSSRPRKRTIRNTNAISAGPLDTANLSHSPLSTTPVASTKSICFRITGIPQDWSKEKLWNTLVSLDGSLKDLVPRLDIFPSFHRPSHVALLNLDVCTNYFNILEPNESCRKEIKDEGVELEIDRHFYGLTPLNNPGEVIEAEYVVLLIIPHPSADFRSVIAVTGLAGHAYGSWKSRQSSRMWLKDLLPNAVPGLRVMTYGYDSRIFGKRKSEARMSNYTVQFIQHLENAISMVSINSFWRWCWAYD